MLFLKTIFRGSFVNLIFYVTRNKLRGARLTLTSQGISLLGPHWSLIAILEILRVSSRRHYAGAAASSEDPQGPPAVRHPRRDPYPVPIFVPYLNATQYFSVSLAMVVPTA